MALSGNNIKNIFIYALPKFIGYGLAVLTLPILTRILSPADFGVIIMSAIFPTLAAGVLTLGLPSAAQRFYFEYRRDKEKLNSLLYSAQALLYVLLLVSAPLVFLLRGRIAQWTCGSAEYGMAVFITFLSQYLGQVTIFYLNIYQNKEQAAVHSIFTILQAVIASCAGVILVWGFKMSYMGVVYGTFAGAFITCLAMLAHSNRAPRANFSRKIIIENIAYGIQVVPKSFTSFINRFFDKYMLSNMLSLSAVGIYNIAQTVANVPFYLMGTVGASFQPVYYREVFEKGKAASSSVGRIFTVFLYAAFFPILLMALFAGELIRLLAPVSYYQAIDLIIIMCAAVATQAFGVFVGVQYAYAKKAYLIFVAAVLGTVINVAANIILIPRFGLMGAVFATVASYGVLNAILAVVGQRLYRIGYQWKTVTVFYLIILCAVLVSAHLRAISCGSILEFFIKILFIMVFILAGIKAGVISKSNLKLLGDVFRRV